MYACATRKVNTCEHVGIIWPHPSFSLVTVTESISSLVDSPSGEDIYVTARVTSWLEGRLTTEMLPAEELKIEETKRFEGEATTETLVMALEAAEVWRTREIPRRTRKSWGMKLPPPEVGPKVDVTVPLEAPGKSITCLK
jgi:hypothetical protein